MMEPSLILEIIVFCGASLLGALGGVVMYVLEHLDPPKPMAKGETLTRGIVALFASVLTGFLLKSSLADAVVNALGAKMDTFLFISLVGLSGHTSIKTLSFIRKKWENSIK